MRSAIVWLKADIASSIWSVAAPRVRETFSVGAKSSTDSARTVRVMLQERVHMTPRSTPTRVTRLVNCGSMVVTKDCA